MTGVGGGAFAPQKNLTRAEGAKLLSILHANFEPAS